MIRELQGDAEVSIGHLGTVDEGRALEDSLALDAMTDVLSEGDKDLSELAAAVDVHVKFLAEG